MVVEIGRGDVDDGGLPFHDGGAGEVPLGIAQVAGSPGRECSREPVLLAQPRDGGGPVIAVYDESVELASRSVGAAQRLHKDLVSAFGEQPGDQNIGRPAPVWRTDQ